MQVYKVTEFAKLIGVNPQTLRNWDRSGLFKASRTPTNYRVYTHDQYLEYLKRFEK